MAVERLAGELAVGVPLALERAVACPANAAGDDGARLAVGRRRELRRGDRRHFDLDVDAVEQRTADLALVAQHRVGRAAARRRRVAELSARAGVHRRHELERGREVGLPRRPREGEGHPDHSPDVLVRPVAQKWALDERARPWLGAFAKVIRAVSAPSWGVDAKRGGGTQRAKRGAISTKVPESLMTMRSLILLPLLTLASLCAQAQTAAAPAAAASAPEVKSDWTVTGNAGVFSDYRFRGISQTNNKPAFQGDFDIGHASGFYVGNWNSNVDSEFYNGGNLEMDFYGGYKLPVGDFSLDFGALYYYYPGSGAGGTFKIDNTELYIGAGWGPISVKYSHAISDFFGIDDSKNSWYLEANGTYDLGNGFGLIGHLGYQKLKNKAQVVEIGGTSPNDSITDWKIGATYDLKGFILGASYVGTNRDLTGGTAGFSNRNISDGTVVVSVSKSF